MTLDGQHRRQKSLGLSFSGGGVRSWAEVAVFQELEEQGIEVHAVSGTSMGSFIAAAVACGLSSEEVYEVIRETDIAIEASNLFDYHAVVNMFSIRRPIGLVMMEKLAETIKPVSKLYRQIKLSDVPKPLAIPAVDIISNKLIVFSNDPEYFQLPFENAEFYEGDIPLLTACLASSAYPIVLSPVELDDYQLVDGGVLVNTPAELFQRDKIEYVLSVGGGPLQSYDGPTSRRMDVALRSIDLMVNAQVKNSVSEADLHYPLDLELPETFEFGDSHFILQAGRDYVDKNPIDTTGIFEHVTNEKKREDPVNIIIEEPETLQEKIRKMLGQVTHFFK